MLWSLQWRERMSGLTEAQRVSTQPKVHPGRRRFVPPPEMAVQRQGRSTIRGHSLRLWLRVAVLLAADLLTFGFLQSLVRLVREGAVLGEGVASGVAVLFPPGWVGGNQFAVAMIIGLAVAGVYGRGDQRTSGSRILGGVTLAAALTLWEPLWQQGFGGTAVQLLLLIGVVTPAVLANRLLLDALLPHVFARVGRPESVLFVGDQWSPQSAGLQHLLESSGRTRTVGWVQPGETGAEDGTTRLRPVTGVWEALKEHRPDVVVIAGMLSASDFQTVVEAATTAGCRLMAASRYDGLGGVIPRLSWHRGVPLVELRMPALMGHELLIKRGMDLVGAGAGLLLLLPFLALIALVVKLDSRGPLFFSHERAGFGGQTFRMWKFRTMHIGADAMKAELLHLNQSGDPRLFKIPHDPRVTRVGRWLRRWSLDELPQLWNVLKGEMSLVGPRPFFEDDLAEYERDHFARLGAKPGITGLWQVSGRSDVIDFEEVVRLDRQYIAKWSVGFDLHIMLRTLPAVVRGRGAV